MTRVRSLISFPNPVNELAARTVASGVVLMASAFLVTRWTALLVVLAYGFWARVLTGPKLSPLGRIATQVVAPRLPAQPKYVAGPPKRFAQGMGVAFSSAALVAQLSGGRALAAGLVGCLLGAAFLEAAFAYCLGCKVFSLLMRVGILPETACESCNDVVAHLARRNAALAAARAGTAPLTG